MRSEKLPCIMPSPHPPLPRRIFLKLRRILRELPRAEREFQRVRGQISSVEGFLQPDEERWLFKGARSLPDSANLVEVGSYRGRSTCCLAFGCRGTQKRIYAVDTFDGKLWESQYRTVFEEFKQNIDRCGLSSFVEPVKGLSSEVAKNWSKPIHFLFVDGSHVYDDVMADFTGFFPHVVSGGVVAFHDVHETKPGVLRAWNETFKHRLIETGHCESIAYGRKP